MDNNRNLGEPNHAGELGLFNAARQWQQFVVLVPTMVSTVMLAISADTYADESKDRYRQAYSINVKLTWDVRAASSGRCYHLGNSVE